jgi:uncharacterized membrane protein YphA (DoxX/SURF4 family)
MLLIFLTIFSSVSFLYYGIMFFYKSEMKKEFKRYGLTRFRNAVGWLQLLGSFGLLIGLKYHPILIISSGGLALLMLGGFGVRLKMKDGFLLSLPSFIFMVVNLYICIQSIALKHNI